MGRNSEAMTTVGWLPKRLGRWFWPVAIVAIVIGAMIGAAAAHHSRAVDTVQVTYRVASASGTATVTAQGSTGIVTRTAQVGDGTDEVVTFPRGARLFLSAFDPNGTADASCWILEGDRVLSYQSGRDAICGARA